jgi:hypothetical protein
MICSDLLRSNVKALNRVLLLFPYEPLDDLEFHAPIVPIFPSDCNVTEDVMLGCHQVPTHFPSFYWFWYD